MKRCRIIHINIRILDYFKYRILESYFSNESQPYVSLDSFRASNKFVVLELHNTVGPC